MSAIGASRIGRPSAGLNDRTTRRPSAAAMIARTMKYTAAPRFTVDSFAIAIMQPLLCSNPVREDDQSPVLSQRVIGHDVDAKLVRPFHARVHRKIHRDGGFFAR